MQSLKKIYPKYSIALGILFLLTVSYLLVKGGTVDVEAEQVEYRELVRAVYATGYVEADAAANLSAEFSGTVERIGAREGEQVRAGQAVMTFRSPRPEFAVREARAAMREQEAALKDAELDFSRKENLFREGAVSRQEFDRAEKARVQARELLSQRQYRLKMVEDDLQKLTVCAPFNGILTLQDVKAGDYVSSGTLVATVVDTSAYAVVVEVDELDVPRVRVGQKAAVVFDAYPDRRYQAAVSRVVPMTDRVTKTSKIYLVGDMPPGSVQAGMTATANIIFDVKPRALLVAKGAVFREGRESFVWKIEDGRLKKQPVQTGASDLAFVEVLKGLRSGELVVPVPEERFREGLEAHVKAPAGKP
ncbi:efflux RND transporter periplasmic adaptor subunit [Chlorobium sp. N1]|uniref:efflux RND transporter periplasmic adaptor subunit n=1 Tax=Chlorobium sp. N1 TaxID=2491138 RepID=UPI001040112B|nr:efflux RND transporter periplasmic adaptor subunit [Chlorobium sp. N1]TCD48817.1 efflux RND transporter periplasmic adaptor subunit [Chlorobium sp. N1]